MRMKRRNWFLFLLMLSLAFSAINSVSAKPMINQMVKGLGTTEVDAMNLDDSFTRRELAVTLASLEGETNAAPIEQAFYDIEKGDAFSGYIRYCVERGYLPVTDGKVLPDKVMTVRELIDSLVRFSKMSYFHYMTEDGSRAYTDITEIRKLIPQQLNIDSLLRDDDANTLIYHFLTAEFPMIETYGGGAIFIKTGEKISTAEQLGIYAVDGVITEVGTRTVAVAVNKALYGTERVNADKLVHVSYDAGIDVNTYEMCPAEIWMRDGRLIWLQPNRNVSVEFAYLYSVNGDTSGSEFLFKSIHEVITYTDMRYRLTENTCFRYNFRDVTANELVCLQDLYCKLVVKDGEALYIESWDLDDGAVLNEIGKEGKLICSQPNMADFIKVEDINEYARKIILYDGESITFGELSPDCLLQCYCNEEENSIVLVCSQRRLVDVFDGISETEIDIGGIGYRYEPDMLAVSGDGKQYVKTGYHGLKQYLDREAALYIDGRGYVKYIKCLDTAAELFLGLVTGIYQRPLNEGHMLRILKMDGSNQEMVLPTSSKTELYDGITFADIKANNNACSIDNLYWFKVNALGTVREIHGIQTYMNLPTRSAVKTGGINNTSIAMMDVGPVKVNFTGMPIIYMRESAEGIYSRPFTWGQLQNRTIKSGKSITFHFIENINLPTDAVVVLTGDVDAITTAPDHCLITGKSVVWEGGEQKYFIEYYGFSRETSATKYRQEVSESVYESLRVNRVYSLYIGYFAEDAADSVTLNQEEANFETGIGQVGSQYCYCGVIARIHKNFIEFTDGTIYFLDTRLKNSCVQISRNSNGMQYTCGSYDKLQVGQEVNCLFSENLIGVIFYE